MRPFPFALAVCCIFAAFAVVPAHVLDVASWPIGAFLIFTALVYRRRQ